MTNSTPYSVMISGLEAKIAELRKKRDAIDAECKSVEIAIAGLRAASKGAFEPPTQTEIGFEIRHPLSIRRDATTTISPRSPKSPTYGSFAGRFTIAPPPPSKPDHGPIPYGATDEWVSLIASTASPYALALAVIRAHKGNSITSPQLNAALIDLRGIEGGAGYTVLEPLQKEGIIEGDHSAWIIKDRSKGGIIAGEYLWCESQYLNIYDWAAVRREAIKILLSEHPNVTNAAITKSLEGCDWLRSPVTPHLVKADMRIFEKRKIAVQNQEDKTWSLVAKI